VRNTMWSCATSSISESAAAPVARVCSTAQDSGASVHPAQQSVRYEQMIAAERITDMEVRKYDR
jgi:hypothetical protein